MRPLRTFTINKWLIIERFINRYMVVLSKKMNKITKTGIGIGVIALAFGLGYYSGLTSRNKVKEEIISQLKSKAAEASIYNAQFIESGHIHESRLVRELNYDLNTAACFLEGKSDDVMDNLEEQVNMHYSHN